MAATAIIGIGALSSAGSNALAGFDALIAGRDGISPLYLFNSGLKNTPLCAQIKNVPGLTAAPNRTAALALSAAQEALSSFTDLKGLSLGLVVATSVAGMTQSERFYERLRKDVSVISAAAMELAYHEPSALSGFICKAVGARFFHTLSTACSTGLHAAGIAKRLVESGACDLCLALGADALSLLTLRGFASLLLIDPTGCKPFDKRRAGINLGEGAGALCLASEKAVKTLNAPPLAYMTGWGASADCHHMTAPHPLGEGAKRAMQAALDEAALGPSYIDMVTTHGTGTPDNDSAEIIAMRSLFGSLPPFCSMKRTIGHTLAASGILEAVYSLCALRKGLIPPTAGFEEPDQAIGASPSICRELGLKHILKNSFGFGGNNAAAIFSLEPERGA
jgi:3-oxoacyl-[acyl-carrier-protein] synthase I